MTLSEAKLVNAFLAFDFPGVEQLRAQARSLLVTSGCDCGCGTLNLHPVGDDLPVSDAARPVEITGDIFDANGNAIGGVLLCPFDGLLAILEVYYWVQPQPGLPALDAIEWHRTRVASNRPRTRAEYAKRALKVSGRQCF